MEKRYTIGVMIGNANSPHTMNLMQTPVYFAHPSGRIYDFLDRVFYSAGGYDAFKFKPGAAVAVARRGGTTAALDGINKYFGIAQMPVAGSTSGTWYMVFTEKKLFRMKKVCRPCGILHET